MLKAKVLRDARFVLLLGCGFVSHNYDNHGVDVRTDRPEMKVSDQTVVIPFNTFNDLAADAFWP